jgi:hypothetical protein
MERDFVQRQKYEQAMAEKQAQPQPAPAAKPREQQEKQRWPLEMKIIAALIIGPPVLISIWAIVVGPSRQQANAEWEKQWTSYCASHTYRYYDPEQDAIYKACSPLPLSQH